jgi:hypothetical protein
MNYRSAKIGLVGVTSMILGAALMQAWNYEQPDYWVEEALISPDGNYLATRFYEAGSALVCNKAVIVTSNDMPFGAKDIQRYIPYSVIDTACTSRIQMSWTAPNRLNIATDDHVANQTNFSNSKRLDASGKVSVVAGPLPNPTVHSDSAPAALRR